MLTLLRGILFRWQPLCATFAGMASVDLDSDRMIVLSSTVYGDDSHIVRVFSRTLGVIPLWVRMGKARRARGEGAKFHALALLDARGVHRKGSEGLFRVRTAERAVRLDAMTREARRAAVAFFLAEFLWKTFPEEAPHPEVVDWTWNWVIALDATPHPASVHVRYLAGLTALLGLAPDGIPPSDRHGLQLATGEYLPIDHPDDAHLSPAATRIYLDLVAGKEVQVVGAQRRELVLGLVRFVQLHLSGERTIQSYEVLEAVFR